MAGLGVRRGCGPWTRAPRIEGAFIGSIGDCPMRWSNDTSISTPRRVRPPDRERYALACFLDANPGVPVVLAPGEAPRAMRPPRRDGSCARASIPATST